MIKKYKDKNGHSRFFMKKGSSQIHISGKKFDNKDKEHRKKSTFIDYLMWFVIYSILTAILTMCGIPFDWVVYIGIWTITALVRYICEHTFFD